MGANDPKAVSFALAARHWSFQLPRERPVPAVKNTRWPLTAVDAFVLAGLERKGLSPGHVYREYLTENEDLLILLDTNDPCRMLPPRYSGWCPVR